MTITPASTLAKTTTATIKDAFTGKPLTSQLIETTRKGKPTYKWGPFKEQDGQLDSFISPGDSFSTKAAAIEAAKRKGATVSGEFTEQPAAEPQQSAEERLRELEARIVELYTVWIDPDKGAGGTWVSIDSMLNQIDEVLEHNLDLPGATAADDTRLAAARSHSCGQAPNNLK